MNPRSLVAVFFLALSFQVFSALPESRLAPPVQESWRAIKHTGSKTEWETVTIHSNKVTGRLLVHTNRYVELGAGINVRNAAGQFVRADTSFQITPVGAEASATAHKVCLPADIWSGDGIKVTKRDGQQLLFQPLGVGYHDPTDGSRIILYALTNAAGWLTASNEVVYSNCLTGIRASIRIRNFAWGIEQDLILHEQPFEPSLLGLSADTRLEMFTEQIGGNSPSLRPKFIHRERDPVRLASMAQPHFIDSELDFNGMKMVMGRAFGTGKRTNDGSRLSTPVAKSFETIEQRRIIVEAVEHRRARPALEQLPSSAFGVTNAALNTRSSANIAAMRRWPALPQVAARVSEKTQRTASIQRVTPHNSADLERTLLAAQRSAEPPAFVLDYQLVDVEADGENNFTFHSGTNYLISSFVSLSGVTKFEGGTILKFCENTGLSIEPGGTVVCDTTNWLPAIFTTRDDDSVGEIISGSAGTPWQLDVVALHFESGTHELRNLRFSHLTCPVWMDGDGTITARNIQAVDTFNPFFLTGTSTLNVYNMLARDFCFLYGGDAVSFRGEHITAHTGYEWASLWSPGSSSAVFRNCLMIGIENTSALGTYSGPGTFSHASDAGIFQTMEGGAHYLPLNSPHRNVGDAEIDSELRRSFAEMTTFAPILLTGTSEDNQTLVPLLPRDTDTLDRGYHYPVIDYVAKDWVLHNNTVRVHGGCSVAGTSANQHGTAIWLHPGKLESVGTPLRLNRLLRLNQIQENPLPRTGPIIGSGYSDAFKPELTLRFSEMSSLAGEYLSLYMGNDFGRFEASHNFFVNGWMQVSMYGGIFQTAGVTNNCFRSTIAHFDASSDSYFYCHNNLFKGGTFHVSGGNAQWRLNYNIFDRTTMYADESPFVADENAYIGLPHVMREDGYFELPTLNYASGPLGRFYVADETLRNAGSAFAGTMGLYHFTTRANDQAKEGNSPVDYGFHYVAAITDQSGGVVLIDTDTDTLADYLEDENGNGQFDTGETDVTNVASVNGDQDEVYSDPQPPVIHITNGLPGILTRPLVQLQGYGERQLKTISYNLYAEGVLTDSGSGSISRRQYDTNANRVTTNWFQVYDLQLAAGSNHLSVEFTDYANNTVSLHLHYQVDYTGVTQPPVLLSKWPNNGDVISGNSFALRGYVDDPTTVIHASVQAPDGTITKYEADMERSGLFWIDDLLLAAGGNNVITLYVTNAAGIHHIESFSVTKSAVQLTITSPSIAQPLTTVSGTIGTAGYTVWVNGVKATMNGNSWTAANVPVNEGGTATFQAIAIPNGDNGGNGTPPGAGSGAMGNNVAQPNPTSATAPQTNRDVEQPARLRVSMAYVHEIWHRPGEGSCWEWPEIRSDQIGTWAETKGGFHYFRYSATCPSHSYLSEEGVDWLPPNDAPNSWRIENGVEDLSWPLHYEGGNAGYLKYGPWEHCEVDVLVDHYNNPTKLVRFAKSARHMFELQTGGRAGIGRKNVFTISGTAGTHDLGEYYTGAIAPSLISIAGKTLDAQGKAYFVLPDNASLDVTPQVRGNVNHYHYNLGVTKHKVTVVANGEPLKSGTLSTYANFSVGEKVIFKLAITPALNGVTQQTGRWNFGGKFVNAYKYYDPNWGAWKQATCHPYQFSDADVDRPVEASKEFLIDAGILTQSETGGWWYDQGVVQARCGLLLEFPNGRSAGFVTTGKLRIWKPTVTINSVAATGTILFEPGENNPRRLKCSFSVPIYITSSFAGEADTTQLISAGRAADSSIGLPACELNTPGYMVDNGEFYGPRIGIPANGSPQYMSWADEPSQPGYSYIRVDDLFETYIRFKPSGAGNIWVTIGKFEWDWSGTADNFSGTWAIQRQRVAGPRLNLSSTEFPRWERQISNARLSLTCLPLE